MTLFQETAGERGVALPIVLVLGILLSVTAGIIIQATGFRLHTTASQQHGNEGFYAAEAATQMTWIKLRRGIPPFNDQGNWTTKPDTVEIGQPPNQRSVTVNVTRTTSDPPYKFTVSATAS